MTRSLAVFALTASIMAVPALAQEMTPPLPAICTANASQGMGGMDMGAMDTEPDAMPAMDQAHKDLGAGMDEMNSAMMEGMTASDIDVAFVCGMIPHHMGAIAMAKAELAHGDDPWVKQLAQAIIDAQEKEIADMTAWLETQPAN